MDGRAPGATGNTSAGEKEDLLVHVFLSTHSEKSDVNTCVVSQGM